MTKTDKIDERQRMSMIGRPGIGGEFLDVCADGHKQYSIRRFRRLNTQNDEPRQINVDNLPAEAMIYDLVSVIEAIAKHAGENTDYGVDLDFHGMSGDRPSLRERFKALSEYPKLRSTPRHSHW